MKESTLNSREKVKQVIKSGAKGYIPKGELCINSDIYHISNSGFEEQYQFVSSMGLDIFTLSPVYPHFTDKIPRGKDCRWPDLNQWVNNTPLFTFAIVDGAFECGIRALGFQKLMMTLCRKPKDLHDFIRKIEILNTSMYEIVAGSGVDGIIIADDVAYKTGLLLSPKQLREFFMPSIFRQSEFINKLGLPVFYHCDGNYKEIIPDLMEAGFSGIQCLEKDCGMELASLTELTNGELCLWGHLDTNDAAKAAEPKRRAEMAADIWDAAEGRKFILGTNSGLFSGMDVESLRALYQEVNKPK